MDRKTVENIFSKDRFQPYLNRHNSCFEKAVKHYKINIEISESFYPLLSILEIALRNSFDYQLTRKFNDVNWFENHDFIKISTRFQIDRITEARNNILREKKAITSDKIEMIEGINWFDKDILAWSNDLIRIDEVIKKGAEILNK